MFFSILDPLFMQIVFLLQLFAYFYFLFQLIFLVACMEAAGFIFTDIDIFKLENRF